MDRRSGHGRRPYTASSESAVRHRDAAAGEPGIGVQPQRRRQRTKGGQRVEWPASLYRLMKEFLAPLEQRGQQRLLHTGGTGPILPGPERKSTGLGEEVGIGGPAALAAWEGRAHGERTPTAGRRFPNQELIAAWRILRASVRPAPAAPA